MFRAQPHTNPLRQEIEKRKRTLQCPRPRKTPAQGLAEADIDTQPMNLSPVAKSLRVAFDMMHEKPCEEVLPPPCASAEASVCPDVPAPLPNKEEPKLAGLSVQVPEKPEAAATQTFAAAQDEVRAEKGDSDDLFHVPPPTVLATREQQFQEFDDEKDEKTKEEEEYLMDEPQIKKRPAAKRKAKAKGRPKAKAKARGPAKPKSKAKAKAKAKVERKGNAKAKSKATSAAKADPCPEEECKPEAGSSPSSAKEPQQTPEKPQQFEAEDDNLTRSQSNQAAEEDAGGEVSSGPEAAQATKKKKKNKTDCKEGEEKPEELGVCSLSLP